MADINSLNPNYYYSGVQNASSELSREHKTQKAQKSENSKRINFKSLLHSEENNEVSTENDVFEKISTMPVEDAAVFLKDRVDISGDKLANSMTAENVAEFQKSVRDFIKFVLDNNYAVTTKQRKGIVPSEGNYFSTYQLPPHQKNPRVQVEVLNQKLDSLVRYTLQNQQDRLVMLNKIDEIKGLIVDFMSS